MMKKLLFVTALCCVLNACNKQQGTRSDHAQQNEYDDYDYYQQELIIVSKTPMGAYVESNEWASTVSPEFRHVGWYEIGLSRNGEEPVEYIWRLGDKSYDSIRYAKIGDRGIVRLDWVANVLNMKLPRPNAENPPIIGALGEVYWERRE